VCVPLEFGQADCLAASVCVHLEELEKAKNAAPELVCPPELGGVWLAELWFIQPAGRQEEEEEGEHLRCRLSLAFSATLLCAGLLERAEQPQREPMSRWRRFIERRVPIVHTVSNCHRQSLSLSLSVYYLLLDQLLN